MACQLNPKMYGVVFRCSLEDGAVLKSKADAAGMTVSAYVGKLVREHIGEVTLTVFMRSNPKALTLQRSVPLLTHYDSLLIFQKKK